MSIVSPEEQPVTFVELFFDLVFVFSLTQVVSFLAEHATWAGAFHSVLVFWLVWWAWSQFTWALNAANTEHPAVEISTLAATGVAFLMAVTLPGALAGTGLLFAISYVLVRIVGLAVYAAVARANSPLHHAAVLRFAIPSTAGLAAVVVGGIVGGEAQYWLWLLAIALDLLAAAIGGGAEDWHIHPRHFAERHGLFVIIALGETLIVAAAGLTSSSWTVQHAGVAVMAVAVSCAFWWSYFTGPKEALEHGLSATPASRRGAVARDAFSLLHFPMLCGIVAYALAVEVAVAHPAEPLLGEGRIALGASIALFVGGTGLALRRVGGPRSVARIAASVVSAGMVVVASGWWPVASFGLALGAVVGIIALEGRSKSRGSESGGLGPGHA